MKKKFYPLAAALLLAGSLTANAEKTPCSVILDLNSSTYADFVSDDNGETVLDVFKCRATIAEPALQIANPFYGITTNACEIQFDIRNYDAAHVLGALFSFFDADLGRLYFTNGSYLGYNAIGGFFDADLKNYGLDSNFITDEYQTLKLSFDDKGYALYVNGTLAYNQNSSDVTIGGGLDNYSNVISFLTSVKYFTVGAGSWWSDNTNDEGEFWDYQSSYLKNISFSYRTTKTVSLDFDSDSFANFVSNDNGDTALDVFKCRATIAEPALQIANPFYGVSPTVCELQFDIRNYDAAHVLGALFSFFDADLGRLYFTNGSYLGYNAIGGFFDADLKNYGLDSNFITDEYQTLKLSFDRNGYALYVNDTLAYNQNSSDVTIGGGLDNYSNVITFLTSVKYFTFGAGSWWSDNTNDEGEFWDYQSSYLKNFSFIYDDFTEPEQEVVPNANSDSNVALKVNLADDIYDKFTDIDLDADALVLDVALCASTINAPALRIHNPFYGVSSTTCIIEFDAKNYDNPAVLGALFSFFDADNGRMYFTNGSYLGYNAYNSYFDANLGNQYTLGNSYITSDYKTFRLVFSTSGFALYVNDTLAYDQNSTDINLGFSEDFDAVSTYKNMIKLITGTKYFTFGTGSWWSDKADDNGNFYDAQHTYLKNIQFLLGEGEDNGDDDDNNNGSGENNNGNNNNDNNDDNVSVVENVAEANIVTIQYINMLGINMGDEFDKLKTGVYIKKTIFDNGTIKCEKIAKARKF